MPKKRVVRGGIIKKKIIEKPTNKPTVAVRVPQKTEPPAKKPLTEKPAKKETAKNTSGYSAKNITILEGLEAVRKRPGMYIGSTG